MNRSNTDIHTRQRKIIILFEIEVYLVDPLELTSESHCRPPIPHLIKSKVFFSGNRKIPIMGGRCVQLCPFNIGENLIQRSQNQGIRHLKILFINLRGYNPSQKKNVGGYGAPVIY